jgi:hypothetical protein
LGTRRREDEIMRYEDVAIIIGDPEGSFRDIGWIEVNDTRYTYDAKEPSAEVVNERLREKALEMAGNAVIRVTYARKGFGLTNMGSLKGRGLVVELAGSIGGENTASAAGLSLVDHLTALYDAGILSDQEFAQKHQQIRSMGSSPTVSRNKP